MPAYRFPLLVWQGSSARRTPATLTAALSPDSAAPLKLVLTGDEDLMLYFTAAVSEAMIAEMCTKLLLKRMTPAGLVERLASVVQDPPACRSFAIAPDGAGGLFRFVVGDELGERTLPHISLPFVKEGPVVIAKHLAEMVRKGRDGLELREEELRQLRERFSQAELAATEQITAQQREISGLRAEGADLARRLSQAEAERDGLRRSLEDARHASEIQISGLKSANGDLSLKIEALGGELHAAEETARTKGLRCEELEARLSEAKAQGASSAEALEAAQAQLRSTEAELKALQLEHVDLRARADGLRDRLSLAEDRASQASERLTSEKASTAKEVADLQRLTEGLTAEVDELRKTLGAVVAERDRLDSELSNALRALENAVTRGESLAAELDEVGGARDALAAQLRSEGAKASQALAALRCASERCEGLEADYRQLRRDNAVLKERLSYAEQQSGREIANYFAEGPARDRKPPRPKPAEESAPGASVDFLALLRANEEARARAQGQGQARPPQAAPQLTKYATGLPDYASAGPGSQAGPRGGSQGGQSGSQAAPADGPRAAPRAGADLTESALDAVPPPRPGPAPGPRVSPTPASASVPVSAPGPGTPPGRAPAESGSSGLGVSPSVAGSVLLSPGTRKLVAKYMRPESAQGASLRQSGAGFTAKGASGASSGSASTSQSHSTPLLDSALAIAGAAVGVDSGSVPSLSPNAPAGGARGDGGAREGPAAAGAEAGTGRGAMEDTASMSAVDPYMERFRRMLSEDLL